jgi:hypothetical protein
MEQWAVGGFQEWWDVFDGDDDSSHLEKVPSWGELRNSGSTFCFFCCTVVDLF